LVGLLLVPLMQTRSRGAWLVLSLGLAVIAPLSVAVVGRAIGVVMPVAAPVLALVGYAFALLLLHVAVERRDADRLAAHLASFLPRDLARELAMQNPSGDSLGKPCQGVLLALRVVGLERWTASVDSLQALALVHALNSVAERGAHRHGGALEHVQGETLLLAWPRADADAVQAAVRSASELLGEIGELLQRNESQRYPLGVRAAVEAGAFLVAVAGSRNSRRPLLLGPAVDVALAMLALADELASPLLVGARAAGLRPGAPLVCLGQFLLPDHPEPGPLYRVAV
jgi:class 3 adenylate cyclase